MPQDNSTVNDIDLVELAGKHAYRTYPRYEMIDVNGNEYRVIDINYNHQSGLDALTVQSIATGEVVVLFQGTNKDTIEDLITDAQLLSDLTPAQLAEADRYFNQMDEKYGVSHVAGNSLGGALASYVLVDRPDVNGVTLNPAILPIGAVDPTQDYSHITNYFSKYDLLTKSEMVLNIDDRIPGKRHEINNGVPLYEFLATNHTGFHSVDEYGKPIEQPYYEIGTDGQPGYGLIYMEADDHIVTSIWTGRPLYEESSERIDINSESISTLASAIGGDVSTRLQYAFDYLDHANDIVVDHQQRRQQRIEKLQQIFEESFETLVQNPIFISLATTGTVLKNHINELIFLLDQAEGKLHGLNSLLNSPPMEIAEFIFNKNISVDSVFDNIRQPLVEMKGTVDDITNVTHTILYDKIPDLFVSQKNAFLDAIADELFAHISIIGKNKGVLNGHLAAFKHNVTQVGKHMLMTDEAVSNAIKYNAMNPAPEANLLPTNFEMAPSSYLTEGMNFKEIHLDAKYYTFKTVSTSLVVPLLALLHNGAVLIERSLEIAIQSVKTMGAMGINAVFSKDFLGLFDSYKQKLQQQVIEVTDKLDEMERTMEGIRKAIGDLSDSFPEFIDTFRSYVDTALFESEGYLNIQIYKTASLSIVEEMDLLFQDIIYQLSGQKSKAIERLCENAQSLTRNMKIFHEQISRGTLI